MTLRKPTLNEDVLNYDALQTDEINENSFDFGDSGGWVTQEYANGFTRLVREVYVSISFDALSGGVTQAIHALNLEYPVTFEAPPYITGTCKRTGSIGDTGLISRVDTTVSGISNVILWRMVAGDARMFYTLVVEGYKK